MKNIDKISKRRLWTLFILIVIAFIFLVGRLVYIQLIMGDTYKMMAINEKTRNVTISAKRGSIRDAKGIKLAFSKHCYTVWIRRNTIKLKDKIKESELKMEVAQGINDILKIPVEDIIKILNSDKKGSVAIKRWVDKETGDLLKSKHYPGVDVIDDTMRVYPNHNFASHVIGHTTIDGTGLTGLERKYDEKLKGREGVKIIEADAAGKQLAYSSDKTYSPENGYDLVLTIDEIIQHFMEEAIEKGLEEHGAKRVMAIAMDPKTGGILAMATKPDYDPNDPRNIEHFIEDVDINGLSGEEKQSIWDSMWNNPLVNEVYEPGSTFKLITTAIGLEENTVSLNTKFSTKGYVEIYGSKIKNWDYPASHSNFTIIEALEKSWNTTFIEMAQKIGHKLFYKYLVNFGLTKKTGIDLVGETRYPISEASIGPVELATISFGHGIGLTPVQMVSAVNAIANDGKLMKPHVVKGLMNSDGEMIEEFQPKMMRNVVSVKTARDVRKLMELVVKEGSGKLAYIPGIRIGGKTGTSEKIVDGKYSDELAFASFVAIAPIDDPKITLLVIVDEPKDVNFGSQTAAPIARDILDDTLRYMGIEPDVKGGKTKIKMPRLIGKTKYQAESILKALGLNYTMDPVYVEDDMSIILDQFPYPNTLISPHDIVILKVEVD